MNDRYDMIGILVEIETQGRSSARVGWRAAQSQLFSQGRSKVVYRVLIRDVELCYSTRLL